MRSLARWSRRLSHPARPVTARRPSLEALEDRCLLTAYTVTTTKDLLGDTTPGEVTLRDVLTAINNSAPSGNAAAGTGSNTVAFAIGAPGSVQTINVGSGNAAAALPAITRQVFLDGWSQGGPGYGGPPLIVLNGAGAGSNLTGLVLDPGSDGSTVRGLVIEQFDGDGIDLNGTSRNVVAGNFIGTDAGGTADGGNGSAGVYLGGGATANTVGGTAAGAGNVLSANHIAGVILGGSGTSANVILGNLIGTDAGGTAPLGNRNFGVFLFGAATANTVGGPAAGAANVISGNGTGVFLHQPGTSANVILGNLIGTARGGAAGLPNQTGVYIADGATANTVGGLAAGAANVISANFDGVSLFEPATQGNVVLGNLIGTDVRGTGALGNTNEGVLLGMGASRNVIGGTAAGAGNTIAFNGKGVIVRDSATTGDSVLGNSIFGNTGPGIDLGDDGPTPNGANPRPFPDDGQNAPVLAAGAGGRIAGSLTSSSNTPFRLEFFANPAGTLDDEGRTFLGALGVTTSPAGTATFVAPRLAPAGAFVTATAINLATGDTSEFAPGITVTDPNFADSFDRPDSPTLGGAWAQLSGAMAVLGNHLLAAAGPALAVARVPPALSDTGVQATVVALPLVGTSYAGLVARVSPSGYYLGEIVASQGTVTAYLFRNLGGTFTPLGAPARLSGETGTLRLEAAGASVKLFLNGQLVVHAFDGTPALAQGLAGVWASAGSFLDDFTAGPLSTFAALPYSDNFAGADGSALSRSWVDQAGNFSVLGGQARGNASGGNLTTLNLATPSTDMGAQADVALPTTGTAYAGLVARYGGPGGANFYLGEVVGSNGAFTTYLFRNLGGAYTLLASGPVAGGSGTLRLEAVGTSLRLFLGGQLVAYAVDSALTVGSAGLWASASVSLGHFAADLNTTPVAGLFADNFAQPAGSPLSQSWAVRTGNFAARAGGVAATGAGVGLATANPVLAADVAVRANIALAVTGTQYAGLVARYAGPGDGGMYLGEVVGSNGTFTAYIFRNVGGSWALLASHGLTSGTGLLLLTVKGSRLQLSFNRQVVDDVTDSVLSGPGLVGLRGGPGAIFSGFSVATA